MLALRCGLAALVILALAPGEARAQPLAPPSAPAPAAITPPRLTVDSRAAYPEAALKARFTAPVTVSLILEIDAAGAVRKAIVEATQGSGFDEAAVAAAQKLRFEPARQGDRPVASRIKFRYVFKPPPPQLVGRAFRLSTGAPLAGAHVVVRGADGATRTTETAADGTWSAPDLPPGKVHVAISAPGLLERATDEELAPGEETRVVLRLADEAAPAPPAGAPAAIEVEVRGERPPREVSKRTLSKDEIALIPGTNGDALRSIQSLPGVARPPPFSGNLAVRGSAPDDTPIFVDGTTVPIIYHFGGLSSVIPTELLQQIDFYPGNYSAMYGRGTGGMIDVGIRDPRKDGYHGMAQLDLIDARLLVEGPIAGGWSFLAAGRRSWFDLWLGPVLKATSAGVTTAPRYYDYQVMLAKDIDSRSSFRVIFFGSDDAIDLLQTSPSMSNPTMGGSLSAHINFWRVQARYQNKLDERTELKVMASVGQDSQDVGSGTTFIDTSTVPVSLRTELSEKMGHGVTANVGFDIIYRPYQLHLRRPPPRAPGVASNGPGDLPLETDESGSHVFPGMYTEWELVPRAGTRIVPGLRVDYSSPSKTWDVSPRLVMRQDLRGEFPRTTLKAAAGLFYQPPAPLQVDPVFGQPGLLDSRAVQLDAGFEQDFTRQLGLSVDVFYKHLDRLVVQRAGNTGVGQAYGAEFLLRYKADERFFGWLAYTISRSERQDIVGGPTHLFQYDQPQIFTILGSYQFGHGVRLGARFQLVSGSLYTPAAQGAFDATIGSNQSVMAYPPFGSRLPTFHQLDIRLDKTWKFPRWQLTGYLDVQNVYNYQAVEGTTYNYNFTQEAFVKGLPILPIIGLRGEL